MQKTFNFFWKNDFTERFIINNTKLFDNNTFSVHYSHALPLKFTKTFRMRWVLLKIYILTFFIIFCLNIISMPPILLPRIPILVNPGDLRCVLVNTSLSRLMQILCYKSVYSAVRKIVPYSLWINQHRLFGVSKIKSCKSCGRRNVIFRVIWFDF